MTQEYYKTFTPDNRKAGDLIRSQDWNAAMSELARLNIAKLNRNGDDTFGGSLTVQGDLSVPSGSLSLGAVNPVKKLQIEQGELRIRASHNDSTPDIATFLSENLVQGIGIGSNTIAAIGENANQDINLVPKGNGALNVSGNFKLAKGPVVNELSIDGTLTANSDSILPTQRAIKTYVDTKLANVDTQSLTVAQGLTVAGNVGVGTTKPSEKLEVNGNIKLSGTIVQEAWKDVTYLNGWSANNEPNNQAIYMKDSMGFVHLKGLAYGWSYNTSLVFQLPVGYRPFKGISHSITVFGPTLWGGNTSSSVYISYTNYIAGLLHISTDGNVSISFASSWTGGNLNLWLYLDSVTFKAA